MIKLIRVFRYFVLFYFFLFPACTSINKSKSVQVLDNGIIEINAIKAINDARPFPLSKIISDVEFLQLESTVESYFDDITSLSVTDNFILIACQIQDKVLLFSRGGKFIRQIGRLGRGPGEFSNPHFASIDPSEKYIIVKDELLGGLFKFDIHGNIIKHVNINNICPARANKQPVFIDESHFCLSFSRPIHQVDNHHNIAVFNMDLNLVESQIYRPNNDSLCLLNLSGQDIFNGHSSCFYWESFIDLVYSIKLGDEPQPVYHINKDGTGQPFDYLNGRDRSRSGLDYNIIVGITDLPRYLLFAMYNDFDGLNQLIYDKRRREAFKNNDLSNCFSYLVKGSESTFWDNDIFGYPKIFIDFYFPDQNFIISPVYLDRFDPIELECLKEVNVLKPEKRDHLVQLIENSTGEELPLLVILHSK